jgi:hypothetical protein
MKNVKVFGKEISVKKMIGIVTGTAAGLVAAVFVDGMIERVKELQKEANTIDVEAEVVASEPEEKEEA